MENDSWISGDLLSAELKDSVIGKVNNRLVEMSLDAFIKKHTTRIEFLIRQRRVFIEEKVNEYEKKNGEIKGNIFSKISFLKIKK